MTTPTQTPSVVAKNSNMANRSISSLDSTSPYHLNSSDNPGTILVSRSLTGDNYSTWSRAMQMALSAKNKLSIIDNTIPQPDPAVHPK